MHMSQFAGMGAVGHAYIRAGTCTHTCMYKYDFLHGYVCECVYVQVWLLLCSFWFHNTVYNRGGYMEIVKRTAQMSMQIAVEEVNGFPDYPTKGEVRVPCVPPLLYIMQ